MPVGRAQLNILTDLSLELLVYRILLLSPFEILRNQQLATTWRVKLYVCTVFLVYVALRVFFCISLGPGNKLLQFFSYNGQIWMLVELFDFVFTVLSFGGIVMNGLVTSEHQIKFYQNLHEFDNKLAADFKVFIRRSRSRTLNRWTLIASLFYCIVDFFNSWIGYGPIMSSILKFSFLFPYYISNLLAFVSALQFVNCAQLCRERLAIVVKLLRCNGRTERLDKILHLYACIRKQIFRINKFMGFVVLLKLGHDFTMGTSIMFMICTYDNEITDLLHLIWWFGHTVIGTLLITLVAGILLAEVCDYKNIFE